MKKLFLIFALAAALFTAKADSTAVVMTANTASNLLSTPNIVTTLTLTATSTNVTTINFYDSATAGTTFVQAAFTYYTNYATNYDVVWTNGNGIVLTNTFRGTYTAPVAVSASTSAIPKITTQVVLGSGTKTKVITLQLVRGLAAVANQNAIIEVDYHQ